MLDIISHRGTTNQNHNEILNALHPPRCSLVKMQAVRSVVEIVEKSEPSYTAGESVKWCRCCGKQSGGSLRLTHRIITLSSNSVLDTNPQESKAGI